MAEQAAWLIETIEQPTRYYYATADWCDNPNHARRYDTKEAAESDRAGLLNPDRFRVTEHLWVNSSIHPWKAAVGRGETPTLFTPEQVDLAANRLEDFMRRTFNGFPSQISMLRAYAEALRAVGRGETP